MKEDGLSGTLLHQSIAEHISKMKGSRIKDAKAIICLCRGMIYEKTGGGESDYIHGSAPDKLEKFNLVGATAPNQTLVDELDILTCKSRPKNDQIYLAAEGSYKCSQCNVDMCQFCYMDGTVLPGGKEGKLCFECIKNEISGVGNHTEGQVDEEEMRDTLCYAGLPVPAEATYADVHQLYLEQQEGKFDYYKKNIAAVKLPLQPTSVLHKSASYFTPIKNVEWLKMSEIVEDTNVPLEYVFDFVNILANFVKFKPRPKKTGTSYQYVVPSMVLSMANRQKFETAESFSG